MFKSFYYFIRLIVIQRRLIFSLARRDVAAQYAGSLLGFAWKFINPIMTVVIFWAVFSVGFKVQPQNSVPFVAWFTAGVAAWFVFAEIINESVSLVVSNANVIKKSVFPSQILPVSKIIACLIAHGVFLVVLLGLIVILDLPFSFYYFQFIYYLVCLVVLALGISWAVSALNVFVRDVGQIVTILLQMGFWMTPIFWDYRIMPEKVQFFLQFNPMYYIVQGYRDSFLFFSPVWHQPLYLTISFWAVTVVTFVGGALIFKKLKPHFSDAL